MHIKYNERDLLRKKNQEGKLNKSGLGQKKLSTSLLLCFSMRLHAKCHVNSPIDKAIICFSGFGVIFILSTIDLIGLNVVLAVTEAGMCHLLLFAVDITLKYNKNLMKCNV